MSFIAQVAKLNAEIKRLGIAAYDMRNEGHLELLYASQSGSSGGRLAPRERVYPKWLENDPVEPRLIPPPRTPSPIRFFLDGSQRSLPAFYCHNIPIIGGVAGAAVLERTDDGVPRILPGMLRFKHVWVIPKRTDIPEIDRLIQVIEDEDGEVVDPIADLEGPEYAEQLVEFESLVEAGYQRVGKVREKIESELMREWCGGWLPSEGLLLVDGPLRGTACGAIGLVKSFTRQYLTGREAMTLFRLRHGERTAAFSVVDGWRKDDPVNAWYQRHFDATGRDPRHALIRLEMSTKWDDQPSVDDVAGWVMRERVPAAKADARWATLLYPVHYLEEILKRHIEAQTRGWTTRR